MQSIHPAYLTEPLRLKIIQLHSLKIILAAHLNFTGTHRVPWGFVSVNLNVLLEDHYKPFDPLNYCITERILHSELHTENHMGLGYCEAYQQEYYAFASHPNSFLLFLLLRSGIYICFSTQPFSVFPGRYLTESFEHSVEMTDVPEADTIRYIDYAVMIIFEQFRRLVNPDSVEI